MQRQRGRQPETRRGRARFSLLLQRRLIAAIHRRSSPRCSSKFGPGRIVGQEPVTRGGVRREDPSAHEAELLILAVPALEWRPRVLDVAVKHHAPPIRRPTRRAHLAPHTRCSIDKLETAFGSAAGVGDAISRHEPRRPLLAGTGGQHAPFVGRDVDRGNLCRATQSRDAADLCQLTELRLVEEQVLAVG